jgi:Arc/MetJ family transcription regulator
MVTHMKTTIDIADDLLVRAKRQARRERKTLRDLVEEALRARLAPSRQEAFRLKRRPFKGQGRQPGVAEGQWETVRDLIYRIG